MTETTEFTTRLIKAIDSIGPKSLTEKTSIASSMIHRYKKGNEITLGNFKKIYQATGFSPLWLLEGIGPEKLEDAEGFSFDDICIPIPSLDKTQQIDIEFDPAFIINNLKAEPQNCRSWIITNTEMKGRYEKGDTVIIDTETKAGGGDFVINIGGTYTVRTFDLTILGSSMVYSTVQGDVRLKQDDFNKKDIIGRIIWNGSRA